MNNGTRSLVLVRTGVRRLPDRDRPSWQVVPSAGEPTNEMRLTDGAVTWLPFTLRARSEGTGACASIASVTPSAALMLPPPSRIALAGQLGVRVSGWCGGVDAGEELGRGVAAHQPVTDLGQPFRIGDRRQQVGQARGRFRIKARRRLAAQQ